VSWSDSCIHTLEGDDQSQFMPRDAEATNQQFSGSVSPTEVQLFLDSTRTRIDHALVFLRPRSHRCKCSLKYFSIHLAHSQSSFLQSMNSGCLMSSSNIVSIILA